MWACCKLIVPERAGGSAIFPTFSMMPANRLPTARTCFSVNWGKAKCNPVEKSATAASMDRATLR